VNPYYQDDAVTIYHGDCREIDAWDVAGGVMVTDPPYGMDFATGARCDEGTGWTSRWTGKRIAGDTTTEARDAVLALWAPRPAIVFATWKSPLPAATREILVWDKVVSTGMGALDIPWRPSWEAICVIGSGFVGPRSHGVLRYSLPTLAVDRKWHPTPKPVDLVRELVGKCPPLSTVVDPFMGAGSTLRAAKDLVTVGSLFSGIGGLDLGLERAGMTVRWQSEIDPYCCRVLAKHWPHVPNLGDVKTIDWSTVEPVDLICGGYPCQPFSLAGVRRGEADPRHLWPFFRDALRHLRPRFALLENVPGHLSLGFGRVLGDLAELGYDCEWDCIPRPPLVPRTSVTASSLLHTPTAKANQAARRCGHAIPARGSRRRRRRTTAATSRRRRAPRCGRRWRRWHERACGRRPFPSMRSPHYSDGPPPPFVCERADSGSPSRPGPGRQSPSGTSRALCAARCSSP
jgi:hypothetical protein